MGPSISVGGERCVLRGGLVSSTRDKEDDEVDGGICFEEGDVDESSVSHEIRSTVHLSSIQRPEGTTAVGNTLSRYSGASSNPGVKVNNRCQRTEAWATLCNRFEASEADKRCDGVGGR